MIKNIKKAAKVSDQIFKNLLPFIKPGITEKQISNLILEIANTYKITKFSFLSLVASGSRSAMPHAMPTNKKIQKGEFLFIDFGVKVKGFCSDCTRTFVIGKASMRQKKIYNLVLKAQNLAINMVRAKIAVSIIDLAVRDFFKAHNLAENFPHSTGHGIRKRVHVKPRIHFKSESFLKNSEVITIEPALYFKGFGGVRIEDMVLVKENGFEILTKFPKELIEL